MIDVIVSLNGLRFELRVPGSVYNGELVDFDAAVRSALAAYKLQFPLDPIDLAGLVVCVERAHKDVAARDGEGVEVNRPVFFSSDPVEEEQAQPSDEQPEPEFVEDADSDTEPDDLSEEELDELTAPDEEPEEDRE